jgi:hypothetical protein
MRQNLWRRNVSSPSGLLIFFDSQVIKFKFLDTFLPIGFTFGRSIRSFCMCYCNCSYCTSKYCFSHCNTCPCQKKTNLNA